MKISEIIENINTAVLYNGHDITLKEEVSKGMLALNDLLKVNHPRQDYADDEKYKRSIKNELEREVKKRGQRKTGLAFIIDGDYITIENEFYNTTIIKKVGGKYEVFTPASYDSFLAEIDKAKNIQSVLFKKAIKEIKNVNKLTRYIGFGNIG